MNIDNINIIINDMLNDISKFDIIKNFDAINNLCRSVIETYVIQERIEETNKNNLINNLLKQIVIKGESLNELKMQYEERYNIKENYKKLNELLNNLKLFNKKIISLTINDHTRNIEVFDTGYEYIPTEINLFSQNVLQALKELKDKEKIEKLADLVENGIASIYLAPETVKKIEKELLKRKINRINDNSEFILWQENFNDNIEQKKFH